MAAKRKFARATDQLILDRIAAGTLKVDTRRAMAFVRRPNAVSRMQPGNGKAGNGKAACEERGAWRQLATTFDSRGRYQFVCLYCRNRRKKIAIHRLVWIAKTGELIPDDCDIHHKRGRGWNGFRWLACVDRETHQERHRRGREYPRGWDGDWDF